ncbi:MAG: alpha-1,2-fucosyltransferase [Gammaproteobacteria bacterium]|uniref:Putative glycosyltransferase n=1 Tax=viral metagenome TaxID=1070528 RepID=A0A6M3XH74_9ZZZZ|nr:alpha-1,2-fucosyltransferase [Gammaproteobacteria bacterium]MBU2236432.1 alpha-1,2-fucosyltransferase [Gammaproteobacteria bacterium]MBU2320912.1 alpha-1,2-fucosyltransferase [Gammaproteobacteria bacterium]MBU2411516.1 alpha-1,2-fucosyltransferase [Gammaproteobacteria bacterium]
MIIIKPVGGLASQLHKYSVGKALAYKHGVQLKLDLSWFEDRPHTDTPWEYVIDRFDIKAEEASVSEIKKLKPCYIQVKVIRLIEKVFGIEFTFKKYSNKSFLSLKEFFALPDNLYLEGEFAGFKYIESVKNILQEEIKPKSNISISQKKYLKYILDFMPVVSIHFRRGDFISNKSAAKFHCVCSNDYYYTAMTDLEVRIGKYNLLVFSDDLDWVKEFFVFPDDSSVTYVEGLEDFEEFQLMSMCAHNIISNSGFSWFSAWLNPNDNIIMSPKKWVHDKNINKILLDDLDSGNVVFIDNE